MADGAAKPEKNKVIEALILAFSYSKASAMVGTDALRSVLSVEYHDLLRNGVFDLEYIWELLEDQPEFSPELVKPPLCLFKTFESQLGLTIKLPEALGELSASQVSVAAADCKVPAVELRRVLRDSGEPAPSTKRTEAAADALIREAEQAETPKHRKPRRQLPAWVTPVAAVIAVVSFGFAGLSVYKGCSSPKAQWKSIGLGPLQQLPVSDARRFGAQVDARLTDDGWLAQAEATRKKQLQDALDKLRPEGVRVLILRDKQGRVRASAQYSTKNQQIGFSFPKIQ